MISNNPFEQSQEWSFLIWFCLSGLVIIIGGTGSGFLLVFFGLHAASEAKDGSVLGASASGFFAVSQAINLKTIYTSIFQIPHRQEYVKDEDIYNQYKYTIEIDGSWYLKESEEKKRILDHMYSLMSKYQGDDFTYSAWVFKHKTQYKDATGPMTIEKLATWYTRGFGPYLPEEFCQRHPKLAAEYNELLEKERSI